jgi:hypothetical protein
VFLKSIKDMKEVTFFGYAYGCQTQKNNQGRSKWSLTHKRGLFMI